MKPTMEKITKPANMLVHELMQHTMRESLGKASGEKIHVLRVEIAYYGEWRAGNFEIIKIAAAMLLGEQKKPKTKQNKTKQVAALFYFLSVRRLRSTGLVLTRQRHPKLVLDI